MNCYNSCINNNTTQPTAGTNVSLNNGYSYAHNNTHVHEVQGITKMAQVDDVAHSHRFTTVTSRPIPVSCNNHVHEVSFDTDMFDGHKHTFSGRTSTAIVVGDRHVHFLKSLTDRSDGHRHEFRLGGFIEDPAGD